LIVNPPNWIKPTDYYPETALAVENSLGEEPSNPAANVSACRTDFLEQADS
jgi:hypothetical protein